MKLPASLRRSIILVAAGGYYVGVVQLTGMSMRPVSMTQFFGHALLYAAATGLISSVLFVAERSSSTKREEELARRQQTQLSA